MADTERHVQIDYTNWRGERRMRYVIPLCINFEVNRYHPEPQWILWATDVEEKEERILKQFSMKNIHDWRPV
jgi:hypothetical protein